MRRPSPATFILTLLALLAGGVTPLVAMAQASPPMACDADADGDVDRNDINAITAARNLPASGPTDPRDADRNGVINVLDARMCTLRCTLPQCAVPPTNTRPIANAGPDQTVFAGSIVTLTAVASTDADGNPLTYRWSLQRPAGSSAVLSSTTALEPVFQADVEGVYIATLVVNDGIIDSAADTVRITTTPINNPPVANAGQDQNAFVGDTVNLNGGASSDVDGDALSYLWSFQSQPAGSSVTIANAGTATPTFVPTAAGSYVVRLAVNDGRGGSSNDTVSVFTVARNLPPTANAGPDQSVTAPVQVVLDGGASSDPEGQPLTYGWSILSGPAPLPALVGANTSTPNFTAQRAGQYVVQLIVNDGTQASTPDTVLITTGNTAPVANAGPDQTAEVGTPITLNGNGSADANGDPLSYRWALVARPGGSNAELISEFMPVTGFTPDVAGVYVAQLIVNDGVVDSAPDGAQITITAQPNHAPVANADLATTAEDTAVNVPVLANDTDADGDTLTVDLITIAPQHGTAVIQGGVVRYTPSANYNGPDSFSYRITDGEDTASAVVSITVTPVNDPPVANPDSASTLAGQAVSVPVLANDTDVDGDTLSVSAVTQPASGGTAAILGGGVQLTPAAGFSGTATFSYTASDGHGGTATTNVTVDVGALPTLSIADAQIAEGNSGTATLTFDVTLSAASAAAVSVSYAASNGTATAGSDYVAASGTLNFAPGVTAQVIQVTINGDTTEEPNETFLVTLSAPVGATIADGQASGTIQNDDAAPAVVTISATDAAASEAGPDSGTFTVTRTGGDLTTALEVAITIGGTATAVSDYAAVPATATIPANQASATITINPVNDGISEPAETVVLGIGPSGTGSYTIGAPSSAAVTIADDDVVGITAVNTSIAEGNAGTGAVEVTVQLSGPSVSTITVQYTTTNGSAVAPSDYVATTGTLTFDPGVTSLTVPLTINGDNAYETNEQFFLNLANPTNATLTVASAAVTITNDDALPTISINDVVVAEGDSGNVAAVFTVSRSVASDLETTFDYTTVNGTATGGNDFVAVSGSGTIPAGAMSTTITVQVISDTQFEPSETFTVSLSNATNASIADNSGQGTITNDDIENFLTVTPSPLSLLTSATGTLTVTSNVAAPAGGVLVTLGSGNIGSVTVPANVTIPEGATQAQFTATATNAAGQAVISAGAAGYTAGSATVNVNNRTLSVSLTSSLVGVTRTVTGTVTLGQARTVDVLVNLGTGNSAIATVAPTSVTIPAGQVSAGFTVTGVAAGSTPVNASAVGYANASASVEVTLSQLSLGVVPTLGPGQSLDLPVSLSSPSATPVTVNFTSADPAIATVTASVTIPAGSAIPAANPQVTGVALGTTSILVTADGYAPDSRAVNVTLNGTFSPLSVNDLRPTLTRNLTLTLSAPAPGGGALVQFASSNTGFVTVSPSSAVIPPGQLSTTITLTGVAQGTANVTAAIAGGGGATLPVTVLAPPRITFNGSYAPGGQRVGEDLQFNGYFSFESAPAAPVDVTITSASPAAVLVSLVDNAAGAASVTVTGVADTAARYFALQGLQQGGSSTITISAPGYTTQSFTVEVDPSAFAIYASPSGDFSTNSLAANTLVRISPIRLNRTTLTFAEVSEVRGGLTVPVTVQSSNTAVGTITVSPVAIQANGSIQSGAATADTAFDPLSGGTTTLQVVTPAGWDQLATDLLNVNREIVATVTAPRISFWGSYTPGVERVGEDLQLNRYFQLESAPVTPVDVTISSSNPAAVLVSLVDNAVGAASVTVTGVANTAARYFALQGLQQGTTTQVTISAPGYQSQVVTVAVDPSGFVIYSPATDASVSAYAANTTVTIYPVRLTAGTLAYAELGEVRGGLTVPVTVTSSNTAVGTITVSPVNVAAGGNISGDQAGGVTAFDPVGVSGTSTVSVVTPAGFDTLGSEQSYANRDVVMTVTGGLPVGGGSNLSTQPGVVATASSQYGAGYAPALAIDGVDSQSSSWCTANNDPAPRLTVTFPGNTTARSVAISNAYGSTYAFLTGRFIVYDSTNTELYNTGVVSFSATGDLSLLFPAPVANARRVDMIGVTWNSIEPCLGEFAIGGP